MVLLGVVQQHSMALKASANCIVLVPKMLLQRNPPSLQYRGQHIRAQQWPKQTGLAQYYEPVKLKKNKDTTSPILPTYNLGGKIKNSRDID